MRILTDNLVMLMRGYIYEMDGHSFFVFGGCRSGAKWKNLGLWWPQDAPTEAELTRAYANIKARGNKVDYVLTHKYEEGLGTPTVELLELCGYIDSNVDFKMWYAGHWHEYRVKDEKHVFIYDKLVSLD